MNAPIIKEPSRPLSATPFSREEGDEKFMPSQHARALAVARQRTRDRNCRQQVRLAELPVPVGDGTIQRWIVQDVR